MIPMRPFLLAALCLTTVPLGARAQSASVLAGNFQSTSLGKQVDVEVRLQADGSGELEFKTMPCTLTLAATETTPEATNVFEVRASESSPGTYCATWVGGRVELAAANGGWRRLTLTNKTYRIAFNLRPTAAP
jgi:hypothetical protein